MLDYSTANMYSIFGGIGLSQTEEYTVAIEKLAVIERMENLGYMTADEAKAEALETFAELDSASQPKRVFGIFGKTRGRHLLNGFGMFAWDSWYKEGQKGGEYIKHKEGHPNPITVPYHGSKALKRGTLLAIINAAGLTRDEFLALLRKKR